MLTIRHYFAVFDTLPITFVVRSVTSSGSKEWISYEQHNIIKNNKYMNIIHEQKVLSRPLLVWSSEFKQDNVLLIKETYRSVKVTLTFPSQCCASGPNFAWIFSVTLAISLVWFEAVIRLRKKVTNKTLQWQLNLLCWFYVKAEFCISWNYMCRKPFLSTGESGTSLYHFHYSFLNKTWSKFRTIIFVQGNDKLK